MYVITSQTRNKEIKRKTNNHLWELFPTNFVQQNWKRRGEKDDNNNKKQANKINQTNKPPRTTKQLKVSIQLLMVRKRWAQRQLTWGWLDSSIHWLKHSASCLRSTERTLAARLSPAASSPIPWPLTQPPAWAPYLALGQLRAVPVAREGLREPCGEGHEGGRFSGAPRAAPLPFGPRTYRSPAAARRGSRRPAARAARAAAGA